MCRVNKRIYIFRHGQTDYNKKGIVQGGGVDSDLNEFGRKQARAFYDAYKDYPFEVLFVSELKRTSQTASHFIDAGIPTIRDADINEMGWGDHEGLPGTPELRQVYLDLIENWKNGKTTTFEDEKEIYVNGQRIEWTLEMNQRKFLGIYMNFNKLNFLSDFFRVVWFTV